MPKIIEETGSLFSVPRNSVIVHSTNCVGQWGAGIALEMRLRFPEAYQTYRSYCLQMVKHGLLGDSVIIHAQSHTAAHLSMIDQGPYYIACVFTSVGYGQQKSDDMTILAATRLAMASLGTKIAVLRANGNPVDRIYSCRMNSGHFNAPWQRTKSVIEEVTWQHRIPDINGREIPTMIPLYVKHIETAEDVARRIARVELQRQFDEEDEALRVREIERMAALRGIVHHEKLDSADVIVIDDD